MGREARDLAKLEFGTLRVVRRLPGKGKARWHCICAIDLGGCGREHPAYAQNLLGRLTKSCGCKQRVKHRAGRAPRPGFTPLITL